jgi:hypothetical protein
VFVAADSFTVASPAAPKARRECLLRVGPVSDLRGGAVQQLQKLSWRARQGGGTCTAEVNQPIRGYRLTPKYHRSAPGTPLPEGPAPSVEWISFDGSIYWVRLADVRGWPRTIRVTQNDVAARTTSLADAEAD